MLLKLKEDQTCIFVFLIGELVVISHAWNEKTCSPCPLCLYDYFMDKAYTDSTNKINSLSDAVNYLVNEIDILPPNFPLKNIDLAFIIKVATQYAEIISGRGSGALSRCAPDKCTVINLLTLEKQTYEIPFSFLCDCLNKYRHIMRQEDA